MGKLNEAIKNQFRTKLSERNSFSVQGKKVIISGIKDINSTINWIESIDRGRGYYPKQVSNDSIEVDLFGIINFWMDQIL